VCASRRDHGLTDTDWPGSNHRGAGDNLRLVAADDAGLLPTDLRSATGQPALRIAEMEDMSSDPVQVGRPDAIT
jgi:hypothetical protein